MGLIRFGDHIELDPNTYELRRGGRAVRLERIPMQIPLLLVERRPDLVTREQIAERVWGPGVFVDTHNSINGSLRKVRLALNDDPGNPRYIRTVTRMGYRFVAEVVRGEPARGVGSSPWVEALPPAAGAASADSLPAAVPAPSFPAPQPSAALSKQSPMASGMQPRWRWAAILAPLVLVGTLALYVNASRPSSAPVPSVERLMLVVLPFENVAGDPRQD